MSAGVCGFAISPAALGRPAQLSPLPASLAASSLATARIPGTQPTAPVRLVSDRRPAVANGDLPEGRITGS